MLDDCDYDYDYERDHEYDHDYKFPRMQASLHSAARPVSIHRRDAAFIKSKLDVCVSLLCPISDL